MSDAGYRFGDFALYPSERRLLKSGEPIVVGPRAFDVLVALAERAGHLVSKEEIFAKVWPKLVVEENNLQVQVSALRKVLGQQAIATVPGRGYRLTVAVAQADAPAPRDTKPEVPASGIPSIAVLPFVNMSDDAANEYFADGIAEELQNVLSKIRGLRVASHTSAFSFKGHKVDIPTVAQKLNVATILEGSVRKVGTRVRITAQLVDVATDSHLWSERYDRELDDIFAVQDDIAQSVVKELRAALLGERPVNAQVDAEVQAATKGQGNSGEAYRLYLQGRALVARRTQTSVATGREHFTQAVKIDPSFALAWAALARAQAIEAGTIGSVPYEAGYARARTSAERALDLEPDLAEAHVALGMVRLGEWDWRGAEASMRRAIALAPGNADVVISASWGMVSGGRLHDAIAQCRHAIGLDPLNPAGHRYLAQFCVFADLLPEAEAAAKQALAINPLAGMTYFALGHVHLAQARFAEALAAFEKEPHDGFRLLGLAVAHHALAQEGEEAAALEQLGELPMHAYLNAQANAYCGNIDAAFEWLERAYAQRNAGFSSMMFQPLLRNLHGDRRWAEFKRRLKFAD